MAGEKFDYKQFQLESWDYVVLVIYFISVLFVGIWVSTHGIKSLTIPAIAFFTVKAQ